MSRPRFLPLLLLSMSLAVEARADPRWSMQAFLGGAYNLPATLRIRQRGHDDVSVRARYRTRAFEFPLYYAVRAARASDSGFWGIDLVHHKLHLENRPAEVQSFAISHGYNLLSVSHGWIERERVYSLGAGAVVAHPENVVRGMRLAEDGGLLGSGYHMAGPTAVATIGYQLPRRSGWFASLEARISLSFARVPIAGGDADTPNLALHGLVGVGYQP